MLTIRTDIQTTVKDEYFHLLYLASIDEFKLFLDIANENLTKKILPSRHDQNLDCSKSPIFP